MSEQPGVTMYRPAEVADKFKVKPDTVRRWIKEGLLASVMIRGRYYISHDEVVRFAQSQFGVRNEQEHSV